MLAGNKPTILVVMHHTFNRSLIIADSRRQVEDPRVYLTVDCLFHEGKHLSCARNDIAWSEICGCLNISISPVTSPDQILTDLIQSHNQCVVH